VLLLVVLVLLVVVVLRVTKMIPNHRLAIRVLNLVFATDRGILRTIYLYIAVILGPNIIMASIRITRLKITVQSNDEQAYADFHKGDT